MQLMFKQTLVDDFENVWISKGYSILYINLKISWNLNQSESTTALCKLFIKNK